MKLALKFVVVYGIVAALLWLCSWARAWHPTPPPFDNPDVYGTCAEFEFQYDLGAEMLHSQSIDDYDEEGETVPYLFQNGPSGYTNDPPGCNSTKGQYSTAGELGASVVIELRTNPIAEIPAGSRGFVMWAGDWKPMLYVSPSWGYSAIRLNTVYAIWEFTEAEKFMVNIDGDPELEHIGWQRYYTNPTDRNLEGVRVFLQGLITNAAADEGELSETWMLTLCDILP